MRTLTYVSSNASKFDEMRAELNGVQLHFAQMRIPETLEIDPVLVLTEKGVAAFGKCHGRFIMDHSALYLGQYAFKLPGCIIDPMMQVMGLEGLCRSVGVDRSCRSRSVLLYCDGHKFEFFDATTEGTIAESPRGTTGFGWDPIFVPEGSSLTYAEMGPSEKRSRSSRTVVCKKLLARLGCATT